MSNEIQSALIAALVALITASITGFLTWNQIQRERTKWLIELKTTYAVELYKARLSEYPKLLKIIGKVSSYASVTVTPELAHEAANEINEWFYSAGGLCADTRTRGAILGLRQSCLMWKDGIIPPEVRQWRNVAVYSLRRDLDIIGLESFDTDDTASLLVQMKKEMDSLGK